MTNMAITRRGFMKAAATATAALGVAGAPVLLDEVDQDRKSVVRERV